MPGYKKQNYFPADGGMVSILRTDLEDRHQLWCNRANIFEKIQPIIFFFVFIKKNFFANKKKRKKKQTNKQNSKIITNLVFEMIEFAIELDLNQFIHIAIYDLIKNKIYSFLV